MTRELLFDPVRLVRRAETMSRSTPLAELALLHDRLDRQDGAVEWTLTGEVPKVGFPRLHLHWKAEFVLACQRCLSPMAWRVDEVRIFVLYPDEASLPDLEDEPEELESLVAQGEMDALALLAEEVLLALPMMPLHDTEACHASDQAEVQGQGRESPFSALKALKN